MITYEGELGQKIKVECPNCGKKGMIDFNLRKPEKILPSTKNKSKDKNLTSEKKPIQDYKTLVEKTRSQFSEKMSLSKIILIPFLFFITVTIVSLLFTITQGKVYIDTLYVTIFIGIMLLREITDEFIPNHLKKKINFIMSGFIVVFILILSNEIINIIST